MSKEFDDIIRRQINGGRFSDAQDVVEAALRLLDENQRKLDEWADEVLPVRHAELAAGPGLAVSFDDLRARLRNKAQAKLSMAL